MLDELLCDVAELTLVCVDNVLDELTVETDVTELDALVADVALLRLDTELLVDRLVLLGELAEVEVESVD